MPKAKIAKKSTAIDMTPMVDLAFLLITFFMLTVKFRPQESVEVVVPSSIAETPVPPNDVLLITVAKDSRVFFGVADQNTRRKMLGYISSQYGLQFTPEEEARFAVSSDVGVPVVALKRWLTFSAEERKEPTISPGIPVDSARNELKDWVKFARLSNAKLRIAIKGDADAPYPVVNRVIETLKDVNINKFNLVTSAETAPALDGATSGQ